MVSRCRACAAAGLPLRLVLLLTRLAKRPTANGTTPHGGVRFTLLPCTCLHAIKQMRKLCK